VLRLGPVKYELTLLVTSMVRGFYSPHLLRHEPSCHNTILLALGIRVSFVVVQRLWARKGPLRCMFGLVPPGEDMSGTYRTYRSLLFDQQLVS
jgi:hypothetical protein